MGSLAFDKQSLIWNQLYLAWKLTLYYILPEPEFSGKFMRYLLL